MGDVWIWSDTHLQLGHSNIIRYCNRPFLDAGGNPDVEKMDKALLRAWRETVKGDDTIINLGDVFFKWSKERAQNVMANLPGHKILVLGNHDRSHQPEWWREIGFHEVYPWPIIYKEWYILSHEEVFLNEKMPYINLHGHRHQVKLDKPCYINVSVECTNYKPVLLSSLLPPAPEFPEEEKWVPIKFEGKITA